MGTLCYLQTKQSLMRIVIQRDSYQSIRFDALLSTHSRGCFRIRRKTRTKFSRNHFEIIANFMLRFQLSFVVRLRSIIMLALCLIAFRILLRERGLSYWMSNGKRTSLALKFVFVVVQLRSSMSSCGCFQCVCVAYVCMCLNVCGGVCAGWFWEGFDS